MNCEDFNIYVSSYIDGYLSGEEKRDFEEHINICENCMLSYKNLKEVINCVNEIPELSLPTNFSVQLGQRLREETSVKEGKNFVSRNWRFAGGIVASLLILIISIPLFNNFSNRYAKDTSPMESQIKQGSEGISDISGNEEIYSADLYDEGASKTRGLMNGVENINQAEEDHSLEEQGTYVENPRKIIESGRITLEVEDFDKSHQAVLSLVENVKGYVQHNEVYYEWLNHENTNESLRSANIELRVPSEDFTNVFENLKEIGTVIEENTSGEDITEDYIDIDNQVTNLKLQEERLREILQKADNVGDLLQIENELNRIRIEINRLTGNLQKYDNLVSMATINLHIRQVKDKNIPLQPINAGLWSRGKNRFIHSINNMIFTFEELFIGLFGVLPLLILLIAIIGPIAYIIYKRFNKKK